MPPRRPHQITHHLSLTFTTPPRSRPNSTNGYLQASPQRSNNLIHHLHPAHPLSPRIHLSPTLINAEKRLPRSRRNKSLVPTLDFILAVAGALAVVSFFVLAANIEILRRTASLPSLSLPLRSTPSPHPASGPSSSVAPPRYTHPPTIYEPTHHPGRTPTLRHPPQGYKPQYLTP
ncbi:hypothetical protein GRF29_154g1364256 [Pseudopithomyces chartarum]|uniref:Uncharacterized protein n=1 Tax=Pseudopithomyces chartarum TaxID=1892770 RepID=A0AAN6RDC9_9PLEO|nr:hypothetical protein GRF29_154g1364256 [Pseudopithomyces chartarum]